METNYGRIGIIYNDTTGHGEFEDIYKRNTCGKERPAKGGIETHLAIEAEKWYNLTT